MKARIATFFTATLLMSGAAFANFTCSGKVTYLGLSPEGLLTLSINNYGVWYICSPSGTFGSFTADGCKAWYAGALAAQKMGQGLTMYFISPSVTGNGPECTALGSWVTPNPAPYHMTLLDN